MNMRVLRLYFLALLLVTAMVPASLALSQESDRTDAPLVLGLDHIPLAVIDLDQVSERYRQLGFTLKPGRPHSNGILNRHVKFSDGSGIELITASEALDSLTSEYLTHLTRGDGPAFVAFFTPELNSVAHKFDAVGKRYHRNGGILSFPKSDDLRYIFFGQRNSSPTDRPEHFDHANGAIALVGVWISSDELTAERDMLAMLGARITKEEVCIPESLTVSVARLQQAEVVFLPGVHQVVRGRRIVGATLQTQNLDTLMKVLARGGWNVLPPVITKYGRSIFLPPSITHGIWLEFRENR